MKKVFKRGGNELLKGLKTLFLRSGRYSSPSLSGVQEGLKEQLIAGLSGSSRTVLTAAIYEQDEEADSFHYP